MRTVVVTGASTGIGRACAQRLTAGGWRVVGTVRRDADAEALRALGVEPLWLDVTEKASVASLAAAVEALAPGGLHGLVNNAGVAVPGPLETLALEELRYQLEVNVVGQVAVTQALLPLLRPARGRIVNVGSVGGLSVLPFAGAYCASKFALEALTDALRMELSPWGLEVVIVEPGSVATPIWTKALGTDVPAAAARLYGPQLEAVRIALGQTAAGGVAPAAVAAVVARALTARRPRTRYLVGRMAYLRAALRLLPDRLRDRLILRRLSAGPARSTGATP